MAATCGEYAPSAILLSPFVKGLPAERFQPLYFGSHAQFKRECRSKHRSRNPREGAQANGTGRHSLFERRGQVPLRLFKNPCDSGSRFFEKQHYHYTLCCHVCKSSHPRQTSITGSVPPPLPAATPPPSVSRRPSLHGQQISRCKPQNPALIVFGVVARAPVFRIFQNNNNSGTERGWPGLRGRQ